VSPGEDHSVALVGNVGRDGDDYEATRPPKRSELIASVLRREILEAISEGRSKPGDILPSEKDLIERFRVARPTMREAMRILEVDGLVDFRVGARGGAFMRLPSVDIAAHHIAILLQLQAAPVLDVWDLQACIEPTAAAMVAAAPTAEGVERLKALTGKLAEVTADAYSFSGLTAQFSAELMTQSGNPTFLVLGGILHRINLVEGQVMANQSAEPDIADRNRLANKAQQKLVRLIEARDPEAAETFWNKQLKLWRPHMRRYLGATPIIKSI
jgi:GntR family transcriptional repressor for pyruvate dehydrogenase complex